ncbi:hypothetical protein JHK84_034159 [Glycine max]|nr:hypothetical protein JHK84_034159 [Glycine max]
MNNITECLARIPRLLFKKTLFVELDLVEEIRKEARIQVEAKIQRLQHEEKEVRHIVEAGKRGGEEIEDIVLD